MNVRYCPWKLGWMFNRRNIWNSRTVYLKLGGKVDLKLENNYLKRGNGCLKLGNGFWKKVLNKWFTYLKFIRSFQYWLKWKWRMNKEWISLIKWKHSLLDKSHRYTLIISLWYIYEHWTIIICTYAKWSSKFVILNARVILELET